MKNAIITFLFLSSILTPLLAQKKKCTEKELFAYDWICYNLTVDDQHDVLSKDTLLLIKSVDKETYEGVADNMGNFPSDAYTHNWEFYFDNYNDSCDNCLSFYIYFVDLSVVAVSRSFEVDSVLFDHLHSNPDLHSEETATIHTILDSLTDNSAIRIIRTGNPISLSFYIKKVDEKLVSCNSPKSRIMLTPEGLNEGSWEIDKKRQLLKFNAPDKCFGVRFKIERIDDLRIRLVKQSA